MTQEQTRQCFEQVMKKLMNDSKFLNRDARFAKHCETCTDEEDCMMCEKFGSRNLKRIDHIVSDVVYEMARNCSNFSDLCDRVANCILDNDDVLKTLRRRALQVAK